MQELRLVLILVGALAIAALLFHGLWTSRKETNSKFGKKVDIDFDADADDDQPAVARSFEQPKANLDENKERHPPVFNQGSNSDAFDPLFDDINHQPNVESRSSFSQPDETFIQKEDTKPSHIESLHAEEAQREPNISFSAIDDDVPVSTKEPEAQPSVIQQDEPFSEPEPEIAPIEEPKEDVIVINVHGLGSDRFTGNRLFNSLEQNGLIFGDMAIYHRHSDLSGTGKVLFSVANMVAPGHFQVPEGEDFSTPGISFFLPLPCHGEAEHNFKLMLQTAQLVSSELGGNILDERRDMLTPDKINEYKQRVKVFC